MGSFRFTKRIKILPGLKLNINKQSVSLTAGVRGAHYTVNSKGYRTASVGLPGTGLSYRDTRKIGGRKPTATATGPQPAAEPAPEPESVELYANMVNGTALWLTGVGPEDARSYELFAGDTLADNRWWRVGVYASHHAAVEAILEWEAYLQNGGTIAAWLEDLKS
jgi:Protein of unknown function (DUF4236)